jgi:hypothetical protein
MTTDPVIDEAQLQRELTAAEIQVSILELKLLAKFYGPKDASVWPPVTRAIHLLERLARSGS